MYLYWHTDRLTIIETNVFPTFDYFFPLDTKRPHIVNEALKQNGAQSDLTDIWLECAFLVTNMKKFFKSIRKKSQGSKGPPSGGSPELGSLRGSTTSLVIGYDVREKELSKLHKAAWTGDLSKVQQLAKKDPSPLDKEKRSVYKLSVGVAIAYWNQTWKRKNEMT